MNYIDKVMKEFDEKFRECFESDPFGYSKDNLEVKSFLIHSHIRLMEEMGAWAEDKKQKCERLRTSEFIEKTPVYFEGKIAILEDISNHLQQKITHYKNLIK